MAFDPNNDVVRLCVQDMDMEEKDHPEEALRLFLQAWNEATNDFEKFLAAHYVARLTDWARQTSEQLQKWREKLANINANLKAEIIN